MNKSATKAGGPKAGTVLSCHAPEATAVCVAGAVNGWAPPGCEEPSGGCPQCVPSPFGSMNHVVEVPA